MSHVYQNCQRANGLGAWTARMKNENIVAMNISFLKTHRDSRILHSRTAKNTWQIMWRKRIVKWQPSKLLWIWIFGAVMKARTTEKNYYLGRLLWSCLNPQAGFAEREKKLYCRLDCSGEWLHSCITTWESFPHHVHSPTQQSYFQNDAFAERKPLPPIQCCFPQTPRDQAFFWIHNNIAFRGRGRGKNRYRYDV